MTDVAFDSPPGVKELDDVTLALLAPGAGSPRIPDGASTWSMGKFFPLTANFQIKDTDVIMLIDLLTDQSRVGIVWTYDEVKGYWVNTSSLNVSGDLTMFARARSVAGRITIQSNTRSTDQTVLDGTVTTIMCDQFPPTLAFDRLPAYVMAPKLGCVNTLLSQGQTILSKPVYHAFQTKVPGNYQVNFVPNREPDFSRTLTFETDGNVHWQSIIEDRSPMCNKGPLHLEVYDLSGTPASVTGCTVHLKHGNIGPDFSLVSEQDLAIKFATDSVYAWTFEFDEADPSHGWFSIGFSSDQVAASNSCKFLVKLWYVDPVVATSQRHLKQVTYIQGSTGTKNITINGTVGYELIPTASNYPQITLDPPLGCTWIPLEIYNGLLANEHSTFRVVYQGRDYINWIKDFVTNVGGNDNIIRDATAGIGEASVLSKLAGLVKRGVRGLKKIGISPGQLIKRGIDYAIDRGYASSPSTVYAAADDSDSTEGSLEQSTPIGCLAYASSQPAEGGRGLDPGDLEIDDPDEIAGDQQVSKAIEFADPQMLSERDIISALPFQIAYSGATLMQVPVLAQLRRYSSFVVLGSGGKAGLAVFEWSKQPRDNHNYDRLSSVLHDCDAAHGWDPNGDKVYPTWTDNIGIEASFAYGVKSEAGQASALKAWVMCPENMGMTLPKTMRSKWAAYISLFMPSWATAISGYSWWGALYALINGKDPSIVWEIGAQTRRLFGREGLGILPVSRLNEKYKLIQSINAGDDDAVQNSMTRAMHSLGITMKLGAFVDGQAIETDLKPLGAAVLRRTVFDVPFIEGGYTEEPYIIAIMPYWSRAVSTMSKSMGVLYSQTASVVGRIKIQQTQTSDGMTMSISLRKPGAAEVTPVTLSSDDITYLLQSGMARPVNALVAWASRNDILSKDMATALPSRIGQLENVPVKIAGKPAGVERSMALWPYIAQKLGISEARETVTEHVPNMLYGVFEDQPEKFDVTRVVKTKQQPVQKPKVVIGNYKDIKTMLTTPAAPG